MNTRRWAAVAAAASVLMIAAATRFFEFHAHSYLLDEMWAAEGAAGHGSAHERLPLDQVVAPPQLFSLNAAPPATAIWGRMDVTHPPLYTLSLRLWEDAFGPSDISGRCLSIVLSLAAVGMLFDTARRCFGLNVATWAGLLAAVSNVTVDYGRQTRNYALLLLAATAMLAAIVRIGSVGSNPRRSIALAVATLATLLSHYFAVGVVVAVGLYVLFGFKAGRRQALSAMAAGGLIFAVAWGPFMWRQRHLFAIDDVTTVFLKDDAPRPRVETLRRAAAVPVTTLFNPNDRTGIVAGCGAIFFAVPWVIARRRPWVGLWAAVLAGAVAVPMAMDLGRGTAHLFYLRYAILAAPAACVLWPVILSTVGRWWTLGLIPVALACVLRLRPDVYSPWQVDPAEVRKFVDTQWTRDDVAVFAAAPSRRVIAGEQYLYADRYLRPIPCPVLFLTAPPTGDAAAAVRTARRIWLFSAEDTWTPFLPGTHLVGRGDARFYPGRGFVYELAND